MESLLLVLEFALQKLSSAFTETFSSKKKVKKSLIAILTLHFFSCVSQSTLPQKTADSLWKVWNNKILPDTSRLNAIDVYIMDGYLFSQPDSARYYAKLYYDYAVKSNQATYAAKASNQQGVSYHIMGDYDKAMEYYQKCLEIHKKNKNNSGISTSLHNIGMVYDEKGDFEKAIDYYTQSLKIKEMIGDDDEISSTLNNLALIYQNQGLLAKAIEYHTRCLKINEKKGDKSKIARNLMNIGNIYTEQNDFKKSEEFHNKSLKLKEEIGDLRGAAYSYNNLAILYSKQGDFKKAIEFSQRSLTIREKIGDKKGIAYSLQNIGSNYQDMNEYKKSNEFLNRSLQILKEIDDKYSIAALLVSLAINYGNQDLYSEAIKYSKEALQIAEKTKDLFVTRDAFNVLYETYKKQGKNADALRMHELFIQMKDSIDSEENQREVINQQYKYTYEKQATADSITNAKQMELKNLELDKKQTEIKAKRNIQYALLAGLILVIVFSVFIYNRFKITQKQKAVIEIQKSEVEKQRHIIEEAHKEIKDSINYAERIQRSFLATKQFLDENLKDYFILFKPKDVVSGDFYWAGKLTNGNFAIVTADSTGHGVPGAIMSLLNITSLEKAIESETSPSEILNKTRKLIIERLKKDGTTDGGKDGMDCSLCIYNFNQKKLFVSAAHNPVWIVRNKEVIEIKPDKMPVGKHDRQDIPFTEHEIDLQEGDIVYTLTDGFPDQFGGEKGKKFMSKNLREHLTNNAHLPLQSQNELLQNTFSDWKGSLEQIDDVCVIGIKI